MSRLLKLVALVGAATLLTGCNTDSLPAVTGESSVESAPSENLKTGEDFDTPWADFFATTYNESTSSDVHKALEDGIVDDQEYAYFQSQIIDCMAGLGLEAEFLPNGSLGHSLPGAVSQEEISTCMRENGLSVLLLHDSIDRNPQNLDENGIMVACLQRAGVVDPSYTPEALERGDSISQILDNPEFEACNDNPLGYLNE